MRIILFLILLCPSVAWSAFLNLPRDVNGWTIFTASSDTRLIYVSASGDDSTAQYYLPSDTEIGSDPFNPTGTIKPYATFAAAFANVRDGYPDWILFKRGEEFTESSGFSLNKDGRGYSEPIVIGAYGSIGLSPVIKTGTAKGVSVSTNQHYIAVFGLDFYADSRDVDAGNTYVHGGIGLDVYESTSDSVDGILIEGCKFRWYESGATLQNVGDGTVDIELRRNMFADTYATSYHDGTDGACSDHTGPTYTFTSATGGFSDFLSYHNLKISTTGDGGNAIIGSYTIDSVIDDNTVELTSDPTNGSDETGISWFESADDSQGLYSYHLTNLKMEGNLFIKNGWRNVSTSDGTDRTDAQATYWNHGVYLNASQHLTLKNNIILEPSASAIKLTRKFPTVKSLVDDNLIVAAEDLIQAGNNFTTPEYDYNFKNIKIWNNVYTNSGKDNHTNTMSGGIKLGGGDGGSIRHNLLIHASSDMAIHNGLRLGYSKSRNITVDGNVVYNGGTKTLCSIGDTYEASSGIVVSNNILQAPTTTMTDSVMRADLTNSGQITYSGNKYFAANQVFWIDTTTTDYAGWVSWSGETDSSWAQQTFTDTTRDVDTYMTYIGETPATIDGFIAKCREQSRFSWDSRFTAAVVNDWIREGFDLEKYKEAPVSAGAVFGAFNLK